MQTGLQRTPLVSDFIALLQTLLWDYKKMQSSEGSFRDLKKAWTAGRSFTLPEYNGSTETNQRKQANVSKWYSMCRVPGSCPVFQRTDWHLARGVWACYPVQVRARWEQHGERNGRAGRKRKLSRELPQLKIHRGSCWKES